MIIMKTFIDIHIYTQNKRNSEWNSLIKLSNSQLKTRCACLHLFSPLQTQVGTRAYTLEKHVIQLASCSTAVGHGFGVL